MTTEEHLAAIVAKCRELLAIAEKRTAGKWYGVAPTGDTRRNDSWLEISNAEKNNRSTKHDLKFIEECAGPAEAGWRATIAAIEYAVNIPHINCESSRFYFSEQKKNEQKKIGCNCGRGKYLNKIIAAWPEELL